MLSVYACEKSCSVILNIDNNTRDLLKNLNDTLQKHQDVWRSDVHRKMVISLLVCMGTTVLLGSNVVEAKLSAKFSFSGISYTAKTIAALENYARGMVSLQPSAITLYQ